MNLPAHGRSLSHPKCLIKLIDAKYREQIKIFILPELEKISIMPMVNMAPLKNVTKLTYVGPAVRTGRDIAVILR